MQDRPTAVELLRAARDFCERDLLPELTGRRQFHTRVLINVLGILEREWLGEEDALRAEWQRLDALLGSQQEPASFHALAESVKERNTDLSARIRSGEMDDRWEETLEALRATVDEKLQIANPRHSEDSSGAT
jgi:hypothetical protein